jgi:hypothetical protein
MVEGRDPANIKHTEVSDDPETLTDVVEDDDELFDNLSLEVVEVVDEVLKMLYELLPDYSGDEGQDENDCEDYEQDGGEGQDENDSDDWEDYEDGDGDEGVSDAGL